MLAVVADLELVCLGQIEGIGAPQLEFQMKKKALMVLKLRI